MTQAWPLPPKDYVLPNLHIHVHIQEFRNILFLPIINWPPLLSPHHFYIVLVKTFLQLGLSWLMGPFIICSLMLPNPKWPSLFHYLPNPCFLLGWSSERARVHACRFCSCSPTGSCTHSRTCNLDLEDKGNICSFFSPGVYVVSFIWA